jgi:rhomboid protease GluP
MPVKRKSILCPNCKKLISSDERICPYCSTLRPGLFAGNQLISRLDDPNFVIKAVITVNVVMYLMSIFVSSMIAGGVQLSSSFTPSDKSILLLGATGKIPVDNYHMWWSFVSANFLHGGFLHILFNMLAFTQLSPLVMREYGTSRMLTIYLLGGTLSYVVSYFAGVGFTIGASGSVCALIGALLYYSKSRGGNYGNSVYKQVSGWLISLAVFGFVFPGINNWAHAGGVLAGIVIGFLFGYNESIRESRIHKFVAQGCSLASVMILFWTVGFTFYSILRHS